MSLDLHIHSHFSDGTLSPREIVQLACSKGIKGLSITDHDSIRSSLEISDLIEEFLVKIISGVELSVDYNNQHIHLLGYGYDPENANLAVALKQIQDARLMRNLAILEKLCSLGVTITEKERERFQKNRNLGRPHIAQLLLEKKVVGNMWEAFSVYLGHGAKAYLPRNIFKLEDAVDVLHGAGGVALVAHPGSTYASQGGEDFEGFIESFKGSGIDGFEAYYPSHSKKMRRYLVNYCLVNDMVCSGGSDYHGDIRPGTHLAGGKNVFVPENVLGQLEERIKKYQ